VEWDSLGAQVVGAGSHDGWLVSWDNSSVGVGNQLWDTSQGTSKWVSWAKGWHSGGNGTDGTNSGGEGGWGKGGAGYWASEAGTRSNGSVESGSLGGQVISPGSDNSWLVSWGHSAVGVGNQLWDTSQGANVGAGSSDDGASLGKDGAGLSNDWGNWSGNGGSVEGWANQAGARSNCSMESSSLGGQVVSPGGDNSWLISRGHGTIGVGDELGNVDGSKGSGKNASAGNGSRAKGSQQLHVWFVL